MNESDLKRKQLISLIKKYGISAALAAPADEHTEKQMKRMTSIYTRKASRIEDIVDEMPWSKDFRFHIVKKENRTGSSQNIMIRLANGLNDDES